MKLPSEPYKTVRLRRNTPHFDPRFDPILKYGLTTQLLGKELGVRKRFKNLNRDGLKVVGIFSHSRSGSHLFTSAFHYLPSAFTFQEGFVRNTTADWGYRTFLLRSQFSWNGLQDKRPEELTHVFYNLNLGNELTSHGNYWGERELAKRGYFFIFYLRNPFRILISMSKTNKSKWAFTDELFRRTFAKISRNMAVFSHLQMVSPDRCMVVLHEQFCKEPDKTVSRVLELVGVPEDVATKRPTRRISLRNSTCAVRHP